MLNIFTLINGRLIQEEIESFEALAQAPRPVWVDMQSPTAQEKDWVQRHYALSIPQDATGEDIEESARFYEEDNGELHVRSDFLIDEEDDPPSVRVAFILNEHGEHGSGGILFSIHEADVPVLRLLRMRARRAPGLVEEARDVLLKLFDTHAEYAADSLEEIYGELEKTSKLVLSEAVTDDVAREVLSAIARQEHLNGHIRRCVMDTRRAVSFMMRSKLLNAEQFQDARQILRDIDSIDSHTAFLFDKINFLMDATVGFININQNKIIKIFSVASVALLPPTLIASVYGMNFAAMPELQWRYGYLYGIVLMVASALGPMLYFRKRGWLA